MGQSWRTHTTYPGSAGSSHPLRCHSLTIQLVVGAQGGPAGVSSSQRPWHTSLEGTGSPAQVVVGAQGEPAGGSSSQGRGTRTQRDGKSCPGGGLCSRRACGGRSFLRPGHICLQGQGVLSRRWSVLKEGLRGVAAPKARAHQP